MQKINAIVIPTTTTDSLGPIINDPKNVFNQVLGSLPTEPETTTTDGLPGTDIVHPPSTDIVVPELPTNASSLNYEVWAATWNRQVHEDAISVVPFVYVDNIGEWTPTPGDDYFVNTTQYNDFKAALEAIPEGRRVVQPTFWSAAPANWTWSSLDMIDYYTNSDGTEINGRKLIWTPWQENVIADAKTSILQFLNRCSNDGLSFDYITDNTFYGDGGMPQIWNTSIPPRYTTHNIYVSDSIGNDAWTGENSTISGTSGPVKTIAKAALLAKTYTAADGDLNIEIRIAGGTYRMLGTDANPILYMNSTYSAKDGRTLTFKPKSASDEVIITGSEAIPHTAFTLVNSSDPKWSRISAAARGNVYVADISSFDIGPGYPSMWKGDGVGSQVGYTSDLPALPDLIFDNETMVVARWPNKNNTNSHGFSLAECATIKTVVDTGTTGVWNVDRAYLTGIGDTTPDPCGEFISPDADNDGVADCFRNGVFTYSSEYDSVISTWTSTAINDGIWLYGSWRWDWAQENYKVVSLDTDNRRITVNSRKSNYGIQNYTLCDATTGILNCPTNPTCGAYLSNPTPRRWYALNILEELDSPGEYFIDRANEKLYFWPKSALNSNSSIRLTHRAVAGAGVKSNDTTENGFAPNGSISRIDFPYPGWEDSPFGWTETGGAMQSRHIWNVKGGLRSLFKLYGAKNIRFEGLTFRDSAGSGIEIQLCENITVLKCKIYNIKKHAINAPGGKNVTIDSCVIHDIGLGAIINTGGNKQTLEPANKVVTRCSIKKFGKLLDTSVAVRIEGVGNTVSYNLISEGPSGVWASLGNDIVIEYNHFYKLCKNNDDAGAIYAGRNASSFDIIIRNNFFNDIGPDQDGGFIYGGPVSVGTGDVGCPGGTPANPRPVTNDDKRIQGVIGIYFDDLLSGNTISQNVFYKCGRGDFGGGIGMNGGIKHKIENNIFIECPTGYGDILNNQTVWNTSLSGQAFYVINTDAYPWYESGGPLDRDGITTIPVTGYSPWTMTFGPTAYPSLSFKGVMAVCDIRTPEYKNRAPWLHEIYNFSSSSPGTPGTITVNVANATLYKTKAINNVFVNCDRISHSGIVGSNPTIGGFIVEGEFQSTDMTHFVNVPGLDFRLTEEGLRQIQRDIPGFSNIPFQSIPTVNYVPESYTQQTWQTCAVGNSHYSCERDFSDPDALEAIVTDPRFISTPNPINDKTIDQDFMDRYNLCKTETDNRQRSLFSIYSNNWYVPTATTATQALSPMYGYLGDTENPENNMAVFPWGNSNAQAATRAWTGVVIDWGSSFYRPYMWLDALSSANFSNVGLTQDYNYPLNDVEFEYVDNGYGWKASPMRANLDVLVSPPFYGELTSNAFGTFSYIINPTTDDERYLFSSIDPNSTPPATTLRYSSPTWLAFLLDMRLMKAIHRSDSSAWQRFAPWIVSTDVGGDVDRYRYGPLTGGVGKQYWKEIILHSCLHGAKFINYFNGVSPENPQSTLDMHNVLEEWRVTSGNSRAQPTAVNRIAVNSSVIISGGRLLSTNQYLWRITAKPSASVTLKAFGLSTTRTDIPQTITLDSASRGAWLTTTTSVPPIYILDENTQQETTQFTYVTLLRNTVTQGLIAREKAIFGGATHDFGSGVGFDANGKSIGGLQYMTDAGIESSGHHSGNVNWYYKNNYRLNDNGQLIPVVIETAPGQRETLCTGDPCYSGQGCYQAPPLHAAEWIERMSKTGEWGAPFRPEQPFPNSGSYYPSTTLRYTWFPYVTLEDGVTVKIHQPFDNTKGIDTPMEFMVSDKTYVLPSTGPTGTAFNLTLFNSFWQRPRSLGGRSDLAYDYKIYNIDNTDYSSVATGWSNVVFYTLADGTLRWQTASSTYAGYPILPPEHLAVLKYKQIAVGYGSVIGLKTDGTVVGWGGVDGEVERSTAFFQQQVTFKGRTIKKVAAGAGHYIALLDDGQAVTWGSNESAQCSDPDTVWTPIGLIPIPTATNKEYITNHIPYQDFFYDQKKSSLMYTFDDTTDGGTDGQPMSNSCVPAPENRHYRIFRNNLLGCPFHSNNEYTPANPQGGYDTPYVIPGETYPIQQGGNFAWSGKINWAGPTGAPNDYQFSRATTHKDNDINGTSGSQGWKRAEENIPMVQASGGVAIGYRNPDQTLVYNSVFGTATNKYVDIAAGRAHSLLLTESGNIETWGQNWYYTITGSGPAPFDPDNDEIRLDWGRVGQPSGDETPPAIPHGYGTYFNVRNFKRLPNIVKAIGTGYYTSQIINQGGSIFAWDRNEHGESLPYKNSDGTIGLPVGPFKQVNGGYHHTCALRENGTVVCWGENTEGECNVPLDLGQCLWIDAGARFTLALKRNGELWAWGKVSVLKAEATDGVAIKLVNDTIILPNASTGLLPGHEYPMIVFGAKEIRTSSDGLPVKYEPGNMWKYNGFIFAPIREDDGCADALFMSTYTKVLESAKEQEEYAYKIMHSPTVPPCITQGDAWKTWSDDDFVNGVYTPKRVFVNFEDQLVDQIRGLDMTARFGPGQYGGMGGVLVNDKIWQKVVSYVKLTRKMNNKIREVWGSQANINHYDMMSFPYYQNWKSKWYPTAGPLMWGELDLLENTSDNQSRVATCPYCDELNIGYPGDAVFNLLSFEDKREFNIKALKAVQNKVFALAAAIAKMCLFEPAEGEPDVLDLRPEMSVLMPQIDPSNFIITGLNHYPNSAHGDLVNNAHKYYAGTSDGFTAGGETLMNNSETNKSRQMSVHHSEQARIGLFNNQSSGKLYSFMVQGVCGSQIAPSGYEFYNSSDPVNGGYKKSFNYTCPCDIPACRCEFSTIEVSSFPISESVANHQAGDRKYVAANLFQNTNRKSFLRHSVWVNMWNDFLVRSQLGSALKNKDEIIWSDNNLQSVVSSYFPNEVSAPPGYNNQLRPCAQGETPHAGCRDIVANPYILPTPMNDSSRIRNNSFSTFNC